MKVALSILVVVCLQTCFAANILFFFAGGSKSHKLVHWPLAKALAARGHNVTIQSPFSKVEDVPNITEVRPKEQTELARVILDGAVFGKPTGLQRITQFLDMDDLMDAICRLSLGAEDTVLRQRPSFDLVFLDDLTSDCGLAMAYVHNASAAFISTPGSWLGLSMRSGNPNPVAVLPLVGFPVFHLSSVWGRMANALVKGYAYYRRYYGLLPRMDKVIREVVSEDVPPMAELEREVSLTLVNSHFSMDVARPYLPNIVEVGGMHCVPSKPLRQDLLEFLDGSGEHGFIYFSFGTFLQPSHIPETTLQEIITAFSRIPQRVVWKLKGDVPPGLPSNVLTRPWLPQQDILGHPKIRLIITHGGILSQQEAVCKGIPLLTVPFVFDQDLNGDNAQRLGYGLVMQLEDITADSLSENIMRITSDSRFAESAKRVSRIYHDKPQTAVERAVFWTEYVLRHKGADHMKFPGRTYPSYQYYLLDVLLIIVVITSLILVFTAFVVRSVWRRCTSNKTSELNVKKLQ